MHSTYDIFLSPQYVVISMITYAAVDTFYKKFATRADDTAPVLNGVRILGYFGVHTLLWQWPLLIIVHYAGMERFELPSLDNFYLLLLSAFLDVIFNSALLVCIAISSPLFTA